MPQCYVKKIKWVTIVIDYKGTWCLCFYPKMSWFEKDWDPPGDLFVICYIWILTLSCKLGRVTPLLPSAYPLLCHQNKTKTSENSRITVLFSLLFNQVVVLFDSSLYNFCSEISAAKNTTVLLLLLPLVTLLFSHSWSCIIYSEISKYIEEGLKFLFNKRKAWDKTEKWSFLWLLDKAWNILSPKVGFCILFSLICII